MVAIGKQVVLGPRPPAVAVEAEALDKVVREMARQARFGGDAGTPTTTPSSAASVSAAISAMRRGASSTGRRSWPWSWPSAISSQARHQA
jgi:hypothetical protein